jgi:hypothetical protein
MSAASRAMGEDLALRIRRIRDVRRLTWAELPEAMRALNTQ